jgi:hypothetical protein
VRPCPGWVMALVGVACALLVISMAPPARASGCGVSPFCVAAPYLTAASVAVLHPWVNSGCGSLTITQGSTFSLTTGVAKLELHAQACNTASPNSGQYGAYGFDGASQIPWVYSGTTGTHLTVTDDWSVAYSVAQSISCGGPPLGPGQQESNVTIGVNGSTFDVTSGSFVGRSSTAVYTSVWTSCGTGPTFTKGTATFLVTYSITMTHGDTYKFDSQIGLNVGAQITPSPPSGSPAYSASTQASLEPGGYSTSLVSITAH